MDETTAPGSAHELLLRLAGRLDDDLLADARELVAVGEDGHAVELVTAALAAERTPLPSPLRVELVAAARAARIDLDADAALAAPAADRTEHRFRPWSVREAAPADGPVHDAVRELPHRLRAGVRLRLAWRWTPAGSAPTPLPSPVLLVETPEGGRPGEVLAYQMREGLRRSGVLAAVEVLTSGWALTSYHAAALRDSVAVATGWTADLPAPEAPSSAAVETGPARNGSAAVEGVDFGNGFGNGDFGNGDFGVVDDLVTGRRPAAASNTLRPHAGGQADELFGAEQPAPRPVAMRSWQSGRRRRAFVEPTEDPRPDEPTVAMDAAVEVGGGPDAPPLPTPVPLARRRPAPVPRNGEPFSVPIAADLIPDPLVGPLDRPLLDPVLDSVLDRDRYPSSDPALDAVSDSAADPAPDPLPRDERAWAVEWASGDLTADHPGADPDVDDPAAATPVDGLPAVAVPVDEPTLLKPESVARLSDADRELLARLQAELQAERSGRAEPAAPRGGRGAHSLRSADEEPFRTGELPVNGRGGAWSANAGTIEGHGPSGDPGDGIPGHPVDPPNLAG